MTKRFNPAFFKGDLFGGITAGIVALPLALAFGVQSGLGAAAGLYGAIALGIVAALLGGTATQISGPTGPMTVVSAVVVLDALAIFGGLESGIGEILSIFLLAGILQILFGVFRIGGYIKYMPYPVISGFMTGIGAIIILLQIFPFLGHPSPKKIIGIFANINEPLAAINVEAVLLGILTIAIIYLLPRLTKAIPSPLAALIIATLLAVWTKMDVPVIGDIPVGLPGLTLGEIFSSFAGFGLSHFSHIVAPALTLAALGAIDSLLTSVVADNITKTKHNSNRELIGQGLGNMAAAAIGGLPGAGATMRTVVNINSGGRTRLSGVIHGLLLLIILLGLGPYAGQIPLAVLAGILITVGISIIDYKGFKHLPHIPRTDAVVMVLVLGLTVFVDLLQAVAAGVILASLLFMKKMGEIAEEKTEVEPFEAFNKELASNDEKIIPEELSKNIFIKHIYGPLFFGFASRFQEILNALPDIKVVILRMERVPYIDQTGLYAIEDAVLALKKKGVTVVMTGVERQPLDMMRKIDLVEMKPIPPMSVRENAALIPEEHIFKTFAQCVEWLRHNGNELIGPVPSAYVTTDKIHRLKR